MNSADERFWSKVDKNGPIPENRPELGRCWLWTAGKNRDGYGFFRIGSRTDGSRRHVLAHVYAAGLVTTRLEWDHLCRNRACVRYSHLEPVTHRDNTLRSAGITARHASKTHCPVGHAYDLLNTRIRANGGRECRECDRLKQRKYRQRQSVGFQR